MRRRTWYGTNNDDTKDWRGYKYGLTMFGLDGNDILLSGNENDNVYGGDGRDTILAGSGNDNVYGGSGNDYLASGDGNDNLYGGSGSDTLQGSQSIGLNRLRGGTDDDFYIVYSHRDVVIELANEGIDTITSYMPNAYTLPNYVENLTLRGPSIYGYGNQLNNVIKGNDADNVIDGRSGQDTLRGGKGNDAYVVDSRDDQVIEDANQGIDLIRTDVDFYTLPVHVENLLLGSTVKVASGNSLDNTIWGNDNNNRIYGLGGNDTMYGYDGNDLYLVDSRNDKVIEQSGQGPTDVVQTLVSGYRLPNHVESLTLLNSVFSGYGNNLNNHIYGNNSNNYIDGGTGNDTMYGYKGNDTYVVDSPEDRIMQESASGGIDMVILTTTVDDYHLPNNIENLRIRRTPQTSGDLIRVVGNFLDNYMEGDEGPNNFYGLTGTNTMVGRGGDDVYSVHSLSEKVVEAANGGIDKVVTSMDGYELPNHVETLVVTWKATTAYGNNDNNWIGGSQSDNHFYGRGGNDTLDGNFGDDTLMGGTGSDRLLGGRDNDTLIGYGGGAGEFDILQGDINRGQSNPRIGGDTFVLGDNRLGVFYYLRGGRAKIKDFNYLEGDKIQLYGSIDDYSLIRNRNYSGSSALDTGIYYRNYLIGILEDTTDFRLGSDVNYVS
ncbi:MAG: hypothetical protein AAFR31_19465 [Cyanobacteria bacterium J06627_8]